MRSPRALDSRPASAAARCARTGPFVPPSTNSNVGRGDALFLLGLLFRHMAGAGPAVCSQRDMMLLELSVLPLCAGGGKLYNFCIHLWFLRGCINTVTA